MLTLVLIAVWFILWRTHTCPWDVADDTLWSGPIGVFFFIFSIFCFVFAALKHGNWLLDYLEPTIKAFLDNL